MNLTETWWRIIMNSENISILDDLMKAKSEKKKKGPTAQQKKQFLEAWTELTAEEGFSKRAEWYLYEGFAFCGAEPFDAWLNREVDSDQALRSLFTGMAYGKDKNATFRILTHLLVLLLNRNADQNVLVPVIERLPEASLNKERKRSGNAEKTMEKYFFAELNPEITLRPLAAMKTKKVFLNEFCEMMLSIIGNIKQTENLKKRVAVNISKVETWISDYYSSLENKVEAKTIQPSQPDKKGKCDIPVSSEECQEATPQTLDVEKKIDGDLIACFGDLLGKVNKIALAIKSENSQLKKKIDCLAQALEAEQEKARRGQQQIVEMQDIISILRQKLVAMESEVFVLKRTIEQKEVAVAEKEAEIAERIKMADVLERDRTKQTDETLQRFASKIRIEYRDFQDALDAPMSCDLGENLRLQLQSVFDILEKGGMKIK